jgi:hypothetical protein
MEEVQNLKSSNTAPSSKTFRDEMYGFIYVFKCMSITVFNLLYLVLYDCKARSLAMWIELRKMFGCKKEK